MRSLFLVLAALALAACDGFDDGATTLARVQRDPADPCRIIVTEHLYAIPAMTARVDGCPTPVTAP